MNDQCLDLRDDYAIHLTLRGLRQILGDISNPVDPLLPDDLLKIRQFVKFDSMVEWGTWTGVLLAFCSLLRKGHFFSTPDEDHNLLSWAEVKMSQWGLMITISRSKTIQC